MLLCDDGHVLEVYVSGLEKVSVEPGDVGVPTVQPVYQTLLHQLEARFQSAGGSNNIWGIIPTTDPTFEIPSVNPVISEDQTIDDVVADPYNEDDKSIPEYNSHSQYGLDEAVNDEPAHYHGMSSDPTNGCRTRSVPPAFTGPSRDTFEDDGINVGDRRILKFMLQGQARQRYEAGCKDLKCKFQIHAVKMEGGNYWIVWIFEEDHSCTINELHNRYCQASAWLIGEIFSLKLTVSGRSLKPKEIMIDMQVEHGLVLHLKYTAIRPAICIDATHLKGKFGGVMFIVACQYANNQVFPLAYGWGDVSM
ncbi:hypothetical protein Dsin_021788 [Dipteronia sinensis]|uniref:Transposase MuDR plant domain-containing protein n=1 Tax=Dipteronia sinensis TaxID=43782 RepID=A0AAE0A076_9ROSI|nr:hypothetical protein Dsin_021788 [Dipteronia sinensis]